VTRVTVPVVHHTLVLLCSQLISPHMHASALHQHTSMCNPTPLGLLSHKQQPNACLVMHHDSSPAPCSNPKPQPCNPTARCPTLHHLQMLREQVRSSGEAAHAKRVKRKSYIEDLTLQRVIGRGGFGVVYAGRWRGTPAAIKVCSALHATQHCASPL
jgi:hypothetical protein